MRQDLTNRCNAIEECYEFMLAYAAQGLPADAGVQSGGQLREFLRRASEALAGLAEAYTATVQSDGLQPAENYRAFLNVLSDCPVGWGHEPREFKRILDAAVETRFWPLYEVVDGAYRLTYEPAEPRPIDEFLRGQKRFAHLLEPENADLLAHVQRHVDEDWEKLRTLCA